MDVSVRLADFGTGDELKALITFPLINKSCSELVHTSELSGYNLSCFTLLKSSWGRLGCYKIDTWNLGLIIWELSE
ncbi:hypothetical protein BKA67DRAFT_580105 [Truncatella angustata]|uniref:Protein kinase domain-containing protein n=1 Tax=Truncatella angustata TaxID=152316 RepID=A0A9P8U9S4_9PEZI|nr:uncharacterized protein BKA67DRAFT_580105 [Truncatella angustata]KAH6646624.1 hypothetical protein BKA67DRAFT_580105 [Truncatella angustata]